MTDERYAIRIPGRGLVVEANGEPITTREQADEVAAFIAVALGEACTIERILATLPLEPEAA